MLERPWSESSEGPKPPLGCQVLYLIHTRWLACYQVRTPHRRLGMVKLKVAISFKRLQVIFIHSYGSSIAPKMTFQLHSGPEK